MRFLSTTILMHGFPGIGQRFKKEDGRFEEMDAEAARENWVPDGFH
jgi:hypothetical protein